MSDSFVVPDLWDTIKVYDAHIQSIKDFKSEYDKLLSQKQEFENAKEQLSKYQEKLKSDQVQLHEDQQGLKDSQDQLFKAQTTLKTGQEQLDTDQQTLNDAKEKLSKAQEQLDRDQKILDGDRERLNLEEKEIHIENSQLRTANVDLKSKLEKLTTGYTELEQDKQKLTEENTKLKEQVEQQDVQLHDLKGHQVLLIEENTQIKSRHEIFTQQLQTLNTNHQQLAQDKKALQDENVDLKSQVAGLQQQLVTGTTVPTPRPPIQRWNTRQSDDRSWDDVAKRFLISTAELFRLNPEINASTPFNYDKWLNVPVPMPPMPPVSTIRWNTRQGDDRSWDDVAKRFLISTTELFRLNPDINASTPFNYDKDLNVPSVTKPGGQ